MEAATPPAALPGCFTMIMVMAKHPSKLLPLANVYCPTAQVHVANEPDGTGVQVQGPW